MASPTFAEHLGFQFLAPGEDGQLKLLPPGAPPLDLLVAVPSPDIVVETADSHNHPSG
jgi:hypothetical protein